jgi:hypothetical protein
MNISELIDRLQDIQEQLGEEVEVRGVFQPNYPLLASLITVTTITKDGQSEVFLGLGDGTDYGSDNHYLDDMTHEEEEDEDDDEEDEDEDEDTERPLSLAQQLDRGRMATFADLLSEESGR